jgi:hypothetical protein
VRLGHVSAEENKTSNNITGRAWAGRGRVCVLCNNAEKEPTKSTPAPSPSSTTVHPAHTAGKPTSIRTSTAMCDCEDCAHVVRRTLRGAGSVGQRQHAPTHTATKKCASRGTVPVHRPSPTSAPLPAYTQFNACTQGGGVGCPRGVGFPVGWVARRPTDSPTAKHAGAHPPTPRPPALPQVPRVILSKAETHSPTSKTRLAWRPATPHTHVPSRLTKHENPTITGKTCLDLRHCEECLRLGSVVGRGPNLWAGTSAT